MSLYEQGNDDNGENAGQARVYSSDPEVSVQSLKDINIGIHPNPTTDYLNIEIGNSNDKTSYELLEVSGRVIKRDKIQGTKATINIKNLAPSIYFIKISGNKNTEIFKIIKK